MSNAIARKARPRPGCFGCGVRHGAVRFIGSARQGATVCIHAPSCSIADQAEEGGGQTETGEIGFLSRRGEDRRQSKITEGVQVYSYRFVLDLPTSENLDKGSAYALPQQESPLFTFTCSGAEKTMKTVLLRYCAHGLCIWTEANSHRSSLLVVA
ncbi:hypothetical protein F7661_20380 [Pseudomonas sp. CFA]|nr:hypothetical protein F7661_20380 [Pseudomonas sp. CFA]